MIRRWKIVLTKNSPEKGKKERLGVSTENKAESLELGLRCRMYDERAGIYLRDNALDRERERGAKENVE